MYLEVTPQNFHLSEIVAMVIFCLAMYTLVVLQFSRMLRMPDYHLTPTPIPKVWENAIVLLICESYIAARSRVILIAL